MIATFAPRRCERGAGPVAERSVPVLPNATAPFADGLLPGALNGGKLGGGLDPRRAQWRQARVRARRRGEAHGIGARTAAASRQTPDALDARGELLAFRRCV